MIRAASKRQFALVAGLLVVALIATLPLRLALAAMPGVAAREAQGPVWWGTVRDLRIGPAQAGNAAVGLEPLPLLIGRMQVWLRRDGASGTLRARLGTDDGRLRVVEADGMVPVPEGIGPVPVRELGFTDFAVRMADDGCVRAGGAVRATVAGPDAAPLMLSGTARCERGRVVVPMQSAGGVERLVLKVDARGRWDAVLTLMADPSRPEGAAAFRADGRF